MMTTARQLEAEEAIKRRLKARRMPSTSPQVSFVYEIRVDPSLPLVRGELEAASDEEARRQLRVMFGMPRLPSAMRLAEKGTLEAKEREKKMATRRFLAKELGRHHDWLEGLAGGQRADLSGLDLRRMDLRKRVLNHAGLADTVLSGADMRQAGLVGANLVRADLRNADLTNADLRDAELSDADLRGANLTGAKLRGADLWRANLRGCIIAPKTLHEALDCRKG